ncbi:MAG: DUF86 domain-containing protein [Chloroflexia bacterium]|jgi:uncharacterized protein with HEPN domain|nr:DUF86 domain-containing protein [Chloroflexia bacterium]
MKPETAKRLLDAERACQELQTFTVNTEKSAYLADRGLMLIVQKLIEIVGEALRQAEITDPKLSDSIPDLRQIIGTRNRTIHLYAEVDYTLLWDIVQSEIPMLQVRIQELLKHAPEP